MIREYVKWDYELRNFSQLETVVDRALAVAQAEPQGPVYLDLAARGARREARGVRVLGGEPRPEAGRRRRAAPETIAETARLLADARNPIILTKAAGRDPLAVPALVKLAEALGAPVIDQFHTYMNFPQDHPLHAGFDAAPYLDDADCIVAVESDVLWFPAIKAPRPETKIVQIAVDPLYARYPIRGFPADAALSGTVSLNLAALADAVRQRADGRAVAERDAALARRAPAAARGVGGHREESAEREAARDGLGVEVRRRPRGREHDPGRRVRLRSDAGLLPYAAEPTSAPRRAGGLGWGMGAALGAKLAAPGQDRSSAASATAPTSSARRPRRTSSSRAYNLPVLVRHLQQPRVERGQARGAQPRARWPRRHDQTDAALDLEPAPDYELICRASGGHAEKVEDPAALPDALARALKVVRDEKRQALLNVICKKTVGTMNW